MYQLKEKREATVRRSGGGGGEETGRSGRKYISLVLPILKFRSIHFLSSTRLRELFSRTGTSPADEFYLTSTLANGTRERESRKRDKLAEIEREREGGEGRGKKSRKKKEKEKDETAGKKKRADGEVRNVTRNVRHTFSSDSAVLASPSLSPRVSTLLSLSPFVAPEVQEPL